MKKKDSPQKDEKAKENGDPKKYNIEDITKVNIESWADEMENMDGFEEVNSKKKKNQLQEKQPQAAPVKQSPQNQTHDNDKQAKLKAKDPKQGTRLFVPKALRKGERHMCNSLQ